MRDFAPRQHGPERCPLKPTKVVSGRWGLAGCILLVALPLIAAAAACAGAEQPDAGDFFPATVVPTNAPTSTPAAGLTAIPEPTGTTVAVIPTEALAPTSITAPTATPAPSPEPVPRDIAEWTAEEPASFEEIEATLERFRGTRLIFASWEGAYEEAQTQAYFLPFQERFGIRIEPGNRYAFFHNSRILKKTIPHAVDLETDDAIIRGLAGQFKELRPSVHNGYLHGFPESVRNPWSGGGGVVASVGLAYSLNAVDELWKGKRPSSWADFWDVDRFPGPRGMVAGLGAEHLLFAQFALYPDVLDSPNSRLAIASLTPEQMDESFSKLESLSPHIDAWLRAGDCTEMLLNGELVMCTAFQRRVWNGQKQHDAESIHYCYECGHVNRSSVFAIPKDAPTRTLAELFIAWTGHPQINVRISNYIPYGPLNTNSLPLLEQTLSAERLAALPTSPEALRRAVLLDDGWHASVIHSLNERFREFLIGAGY